MTIFERLKKLCEEQKISLNQLEEKLHFAKNYLYAWKKKTPGGDKLKIVADYFDVSTDYLLGRTDKKKYFDLTEDQSSEYFAIQRNSKKLTQNEQKRLLKIMKATFDKLDEEKLEEDDSDDYL